MQNKKILKLIGLAVLFTFPVLYLVYQSWDANPKEVISENNSTPALVDIASLEVLVKKEPTFEHLINLSMAYVNNKAPGKSIDYLKEAIRLNPNSAIAYNNIGVAYTMLQQYQNGVDACSQALKIDSSFQLAKNNLKWASDEKAKVLTIIADQEKVTEGKRDIPFFTEYGLNYFKIGEYGRSIEIWSKIIELDKKNVTALNNIGTAFMMKGQIDDAVILFQKALELEPNNQLAKNNLNWANDEKLKTIK